MEGQTGISGPAWNTWKGILDPNCLSDVSYLEFLVQFSLYPVGNMSQSDFSPAQLWPRLQFQVRRRPEAIPATAMTKVRLWH